MFKSLKKQIQRYFGFNNAETGGFLILILLTFLFIFIPFIYKNFLKSDFDQNKSDQAKLDSLQKALLSKIETEKSDENSNKADFTDGNFSDYNAPKKEYSLFNFDPNTLSKEGFEKLGIPEFIAARIIKYRNAGGKFKKNEDFSKIYGLLPTTYSKLEPYIKIENENSLPNERSSNEKANIPESNFEKSVTTISKYPVKKPVIFDLNKADTTVLMNIKGIGSKLSARIIKTRDLFGGFYSENQIKEVYGLDSALVDEILKYARIKSGIYRKININNAENIKHPFIKAYLAKAIIAYRNEHGRFNEPNDLKKIKIMDEATLTKIKPYLSFD